MTDFTRRARPALGLFVVIAVIGTGLFIAALAVAQQIAIAVGL